MPRFLPALRQQLSRPGQLERKVLRVGGGIYGPGPGAYGGDRASAWDMETVITDGYERSVWVYKCVEMIASDIARLNFVYRKGDATLDEHPVYRLLNVRSNPHEVGLVFKKRMVALYLLSKKGVFVEITRDRRGLPTRFDLLPPERMTPIPTVDGDYIDKWEFTDWDGSMKEKTHDNIIWIRNPHPTDPFSGVTPLEAAGISVELDHLARLYNVSFMRRDARPGGVIGVDADGLDDAELERIESKFQPGAQYAGQLTVIGTGPGGLDYVDTAAKPRDMNYENTSSTARDEILAAFGVPQSLLGLTHGITYENAEQDKYTYWSQPVLQHLEIISSAFIDDDDPTWVPGFDLSKVDVLSLPARKRRDEARLEFNEGLRSADEYRGIAGLEPFDNAQSRALWQSSAKAPIPRTPEDKTELGLDMGEEQATIDGFTDSPLGQGAEGGDGPGRGQGPAALAVAQARANPGPDSPQTLTSEALQADSPMAAHRQALLPANRVEDEYDNQLETKALPPPGETWYDPGAGEQERLEAAVAAALAALLARQRGVVAARLQSPKTRKGTRLWVPDSPTDTRGGDSPLDTAAVVDAARWEQEVADTLLPVVGPSAAAAAAGLLLFLTGQPTGGGDVPVDVTAAVKPLTDAAAVAAVLAAVAAMSGFLGQVADDVEEVLLTGGGLEQILAAVDRRYDTETSDLVGWVSRQVAGAALSGARDRVAQSMLPDPDTAARGNPPRVVRTWRTRLDERVRPAHQQAEQQTRLMGEPFQVGGFPMRFPGDPLAPPALVRNCRCWLIYRVEGRGGLIGPPVPEPESAAKVKVTVPRSDPAT